MRLRPLLTLAPKIPSHVLYSPLIVCHGHVQLPFCYTLPASIASFRYIRPSYFVEEIISRLSHPEHPPSSSDYETCVPLRRTTQILLLAPAYLLLLFSSCLACQHSPSSHPHVTCLLLV